MANEHSKTYRTWVEIKLDNVKHNMSLIRKSLEPETRIMAVVKADGYGHGAKQIAEVALANGADYLGVATLDEALQLREQGFSCQILVMTQTHPSLANVFVENDITATVFSVEYAKALSQAGAAAGKTANIHIKIDTGMTRVGFQVCGASVGEIINISKHPHINIEGVFTHFAVSDECDKSFTIKQFKSFMELCDKIKESGINIPIKHCSNSGAVIQFPEMQLDMVRPGIMIYGLYPSRHTKINNRGFDLRPAMTMKSNIVCIRYVGKGETISYGRTYETPANSVIATIPAGYADGYMRLLSNCGQVSINGQLVPIVGRICMDQFMADVSRMNPRPNDGDEVILFGDVAEIDADEVAQNAETINYEIVSQINKRVPRIYI